MGEEPTQTTSDLLPDSRVLEPEVNDLPAWDHTFEQRWTATDKTQIFSSPRVADLDGDGHGEIILGHGLEFDQAENRPIGYVTARHGDDGRELWRTEARQEIVGTAVLLQIDDDGVLDAVIGGRNAELMALSGADGHVLWQFYPDGGAREDGWFNFYSAQRLDDLDDDGVDDLLVANGGDATAPKFEVQPPGNIMVFSGRTGEIVAFASNPDDQPMYMSPLAYGGPTPEQTTVLIGSGGETLAGRLWATTLADLLAGDISDARPLTEPTTHKGIIAPPSLADLTGDGTPDIVANVFDGRIIALDGASFETLWTVAFEGAETYASPVLGFFDEDDVPDVFCGFSIGAWPTYRSVEYALVDGATGEVLWRSARDDASFLSSPLAVDLTGDGLDEILWISADGFSVSQLIVLDPSDLDLGPTRIEYVLGGGLASPWVGDIDQDGSLDLVLSWSTYEPKWHVERLDLHAPVPSRISWGAYLGTHGDGHLVGQ